jgi:CPA2 family monovalent cation:H+ antiporter-2
LVLIALGIAFWRGAANLHGRVRAGAQTIVDAIVAQAKKGSISVKSAHPHHAPSDPLGPVRKMLPGLGEPVPFQLNERSPAVGKSLAELNLRGLTGATVLAITRGEEALLIPKAKEVLQAGDVLALAGSHEAIDAARALLTQVRSEVG